MIAKTIAKLCRRIGLMLLFLLLAMAAATVAHADDDAPPQVDPGCADGCPPLIAEAGQPRTFSFGYSDFVGVASCTLYVDLLDQGLMTLTAPGGTLGFASKDHTFTTLGLHTVGATCKDAAGNEGGGKIARDVNVVDTTPPDTTITSAVDGNGDVVENGASTLSTAIKFAVAGTDSVGVSAFECRLVGQSFSSCASPKAYSALVAGNYTFEVRAIDASGNTDPTPPSFTCSILTPSQAIQDLVEAVKSLNLQQGVDNSLDVKLAAALKDLDDIKQNNNTAAVKTLQSFIQEVEAQRAKSLTDAQADSLIDAARAIIDSLSAP